LYLFGVRLVYSGEIYSFFVSYALLGSSDIQFN
jgi:hypothetical protein